MASQESGAGSEGEVMSALEKLVSELLNEIDSIVDQKVEAKLPEMIRALGLRPAPEEGREADHFVDAIEIAKLLGRDVSTPEAIRSARKHVYNLANLGRIPCSRPTPRRMLFDPNAVRKALKDAA
jgi:hypothetical protein